MERLEHAWNVFSEKEPSNIGLTSVGGNYGGRRSLSLHTKSKFAQAIFNRIAVDVSVTSFTYIKVDEKTDDYVILKDKGLNKILTKSANRDQTHIQFLHDLVFSLLDEGVIAVVPTSTDIDLSGNSGGVDYEEMRVAKIIEWFPNHVKLNVYDQDDGRYKDVIVEKNHVAIIENPLYSVVNGPNVTLNRLLTKMSLVDNLDNVLSSGRLDIIIQMPYTTKADIQKKRAEDRIKTIEENLKSGNNGIAYVDASEKVIQLNRAANSQLVDSVNMLKTEFYNQLGLTEAVMNGTATESQMRLYYSRTIDPIISNILAEFNRKFISKTAATQGHIIEANRDMFKLVPLETIASLGDTLKRNSVMTSNEIRRRMGLPRHNDPSADLLVNPNMPADDQNFSTGYGSIVSPDDEDDEIKRHQGQNGDINNKEVNHGI